MQHPMLSRRAFDRFYGSSSLFIIGASLIDGIAAHVPEAMDLLVLDSEGTLRCPAESLPPEEDRLAPLGAPVGLQTILVSDGEAAAGRSLADYVADQSGHPAPPVDQAADASDIAGLLARLLSAAASADADRRKRAANVETELAVLRRDYERSLVNLEKARRIVRGAGFGTRYSTLSVPAGQDSVGPESGQAGPLAPHEARFQLPADTAGLQGVSLHCRRPEGELAAGTLHISIKREADGRLLGKAEADFAALMDGWIYFELVQVSESSFGDGLLTLEWVAASEGAVPRFSLCDGEADRFGAVDDTTPDNRRTLAMRIWSGFAPGALQENGHFRPPTLERCQSTVDALMERAIVMTGGAGDAEALNDIVTRDPEGRWVQTHAQAKSAAGLMFAGLVPAGADELSVLCEMAHESGPTCLFLVAVGGAAAPDPALADRLLADARAQGAQSGFDQTSGVQWSAAVVPPGATAEVQVDLSALADDQAPQNLYLAVLPAAGSHQYGWCRWHTVRVAFDSIEKHSTAYQALLKDRQFVQRMRSLKFPEIGERLEFLAGQARLQELTRDFGFSPMIVGDDNGSLQTHPIKEEVSGALYRRGAPAGSTRVACDVETAHERAPDFIYVLALMPVAEGDRSAVFKAMIGDVIDDKTTLARGRHEPTGSLYCVKRLRALEVEALSIDLDAPLDSDHDIVAAVLPVHHLVSYGWCRWLSLSIASAAEPEQFVALSAPDG